MSRLAGTDPTDTTFEILTHGLRREILCLLDKQDDSLTDDELAVALATVYDVPERDIAVALQHVHLPKLRQADYIDYDDRSGDIHYRGSELVELLHDNGFMNCRTCGDEVASGDG